MPIRQATTTMLKQECLNCGAEHTIPLKQGYSKSKKEPYALADGDALEVKVDGEAAPQTVAFAAVDFADIGAALASEVAAKADAVLAGATADVDSGAVRVVSDSTAMATTSIEVTGGAASAKLGFDGRRYGALHLGVTKGTGASKRTAIDTIDLPHCPECSAKECLVRTWDTVPAEHASTRFAMHRRGVNALAEYLKGQGYSDPDAKPTHDAEPSGPPEMEPGFPPGPIDVPTARRRKPPRPGEA